MSDDPFFQSVSVSIPFEQEYSAGKVNRILKSLGATLYYDVYSFDRSEKGPIWQSESFAYTDLFCKGVRVDAQETSDCLELIFPLATIGSEYIGKFTELVEKCAEAFQATPLYKGEVTSKERLLSVCDNFVSRLMAEWGEEPGSESLRIMIETQ